MMADDSVVNTDTAQWHDPRGTGSRFLAGVTGTQAQEHQKQQQMAVAPLSQALQADQVRLALYADPNDPTKPVQGKEHEYQQTMTRMEQTIAQMRSIMGQSAPHKGIADRLHIGRDLASRLKQYEGQNKQMAQNYAAGSLPFEMTAEGQKEKAQHKNRMDEAEARQKSNWQNVKLPDGSTVSIDLTKSEMPPGGVIVKGAGTQGGRPVVLGRTSTKDALKLVESGVMEYTMPNGQKLTKEILESLPSYMEIVQVRQGDKDFYFPVDQRTHVSTIGNVRYQIPDIGQVVGSTTPLGEARTPTTTTDPFGMTQTTTPAAPGITAGGAKPPTAAQPASPAAPKPVGPKTKKLQETRTGAPQLDANGHIPEGAANPYLVTAANQLLDGMDVNKLPITKKAQEAAAHLAEQYGWRQGMWTPRERMQVDQSRQLISEIRNDKDLMGVFESSGWLLDPVRRSFIGSAINADKKTYDSITTAGKLKFLSPTEIKFIQDMRNLIGRVQGLVQLTRGSGRPTEQAVNRVIKEIPDIISAQSAEQANHAFDLIENEMDIAMPKGSMPHGAVKSYKQTATGPNGHKIGSDDGDTWYDVKTGKKVQ